MPRYADSDNETDRDEGKSNKEAGDGYNEPRSMRDSLAVTRGSKDDEARRLLKWTSFARPKTVLGFDLLSPAYVPTQSTKTKGYSICFERVLGFPIPSSILMDVDQGGIDV